MKIRKTIAMIMALSILGGAVIPNSVSAATEVQTVYTDNDVMQVTVENNIKFRLYEDHASIIGHEGEIKGDFIVPSEINGLPVTALGHEAFAECDDITSVVIPESVVYVGSGVFRDCKNLKSAEFQGELFDYDVEYGKEDYIDGMFLNCPAFEELTYKAVDLDVHKEYFSLWFILFHEGQRYDRKKTDETYDTLYTYESDLHILCPRSFKKITVSGGKSLPTYEFYGLSSLEEVILADNIERIEWQAFYMCQNLKKVHLPKSLKEIGAFAFASCNNIEFGDLELPPELETIGVGAFKNSNNITSVTFPASLKKIGTSAFENCKNLKKAVFASTPVLNSKWEAEVMNPDMGCGIFADCPAIEEIEAPFEIMPFINSLGITRDMSFEETMYSTSIEYIIKYIAGDANGDGSIALNDAVLIMQYISNPDKYQLSDEAKKAADVAGNGDGITNKDALAIQKYLLKLIDSLPLNEYDTASVLTAPKDLPEGFIAIDPATKTNKKDNMDYVDINFQNKVYSDLILGVNDAVKKNYKIDPSFDLCSDMLWINGNFYPPTSSHILNIFSNASKYIILGDCYARNQIEINKTYDIPKKEDGFSVRDVPYIYIDECFSCEGGFAIKSVSDVSDQPLNIFAGSIDSSFIGKDDIYADVYLMDEDADNVINCIGSSLKLKKWNGVEKSENFTSTGGNIFCNGNLTITNVEIDGDLCVNGDLTIGERVVVHGNICCKGTVTVADETSEESHTIINTPSEDFYPADMTREKIYGIMTENGFVPASEETKLIDNVSDIRNRNGFDSNGQKNNSMYPNISEVMKKIANKEKIPVRYTSKNEEIVNYELDSSKYLYFHDMPKDNRSQEFFITGKGDCYIVFDNYSVLKDTKIILDDENCNFHIILLGENEITNHFVLSSKRINESTNLTNNMPLNVFMYSDENASLSFFVEATITAHALTPDMRLFSEARGVNEYTVNGQAANIRPFWIGSGVFRDMLLKLGAGIFYTCDSNCIEDVQNE